MKGYLDSELLNAAKRGDEAAFSNSLNAAKRGDEAALKRCIEPGGNVNVKGPRGSTLLHMSAVSRSEGCCRILLDHKAPVNAVKKNRSTPLHYAAESGSEGCCRILLDHKAPVNAVNKNGSTPLHYAAESGSEGCCRILLDHKTPVNAVNKNGSTPLHYAAESGSEGCCRILLDHKAPVNAVNKNGSTPLHYAAESGSEGCCRILLDHKTPVNAVNKNGSTPLHYAAESGSEGCCRILLDHKAPVNAVNKNGNTPLHYAAKSRSEGCCRILLDHKARVNAVNKYVATPLHKAAESGSEGCCRILLDHKAPVNAVNNDDNTPLHYAAKSGSEGCCRILLDHKAPVNAVNKSGDTPLHKACYNYKGQLGYYNVIVLLIRAGADISLKNQKSTLHRKLMEQGSRPVDVVKVFLCGDASAGKTTIKATLTRKLSVISMIRDLFTSAKKKDEESKDYIKTPGIDVHKQSVKGVGQFLFWDCAGQTEYAITHGMFLGSAQSVFVVLYDLQQISQGKMPSTKYWLPFIKATRGQQDKPQVILVGSHLDKIQDQPNASRAAEQLIQRCQEMFDETLDIDDAVILVDAREDNSEGMELLKNVLSKRRKQIIGTERLPKLCDKMQNIIKPWRGEEVPVISWSEYLKRVKQQYRGMDKDTLKSVTSYLHMMGEVYLAEFAEKETQVILNTQWFTSEIIGSAFAGEEFNDQFDTLPDKPYYTLQQLRDFFTKKMDIAQLLSLLIHMDLVHETADQKFLLPGKLPNAGQEVDWDTSKAYDVKGRSIECVEEVDIFNPNVFPCVQKQILDECRSRGSTTKISRSAVKFAIGSILVFVKLTKHKRSINVAAMCPDKDSREDCYQSLLHVVELIQEALLEKSPGTNLRESYISHDCLTASKNLEGVTTYTKEDLMKAEEKDGIVDSQVQPEEVTKILFQGYDKMFLQEFGSQCRYVWIPVKTVTRCFGRLDRVHEWGEDYRAIGKALGIPKHEVDQLAEDSRTQKESTTANIIRKWCQDKKRKMTIGMLQKLLGRLSLVANEDALNAIDEVVNLHKSKYRHDDEDENAFEISVSETLARWRLVIKRQWSVLTADMDPNMLTSRLPYLPLKDCTVFEGTKSTDVQQRIKNVETLLLFLLDRDEEDWPEDLICGFRETDQRPLAQTLEEEFEKVGRESAERKEKRRQVSAGRQNNNKDIEHITTKPTNESNEDVKQQTREEASGRSLIDKFKEVTGVEEAETASHYLRATNEDVDAAIALYFTEIEHSRDEAACATTTRDLPLHQHDQSYVNLVAQFQEFTGCMNMEESQQFLQNHNMNVKEAVEAYFQMAE